MVARRLKFTSPGSPPGAAGRRRATRTRASTLDRVHEPLEFVASHAAAFHQSRRQRVDFALVLSQYLSRGCATVGDPSLNFLYLANLVSGKQVQCVRAITAAGPIWQEMAEDYFGLMARVEIATRSINRRSSGTSVCACSPGRSSQILISRTRPPSAHPTWHARLHGTRWLPGNSIRLCFRSCAYPHVAA